MPYTTSQHAAAPAVKDEFDMGPLSWVKPEIQSALSRADEGISKFAARPGDRDLARGVLPLLHQVTGALHMVGLEGVALISAVTENLVEALGRGDVKPNEEVVGTVRGAIKALDRYLEGLMRGEPNRPLVLFPTYRAVLAATGADAANAVDLFSPDLSRKPEFTTSAASSAAVPAGPEQRRVLVRRRTEFQKGLLQVLRGVDHQHNLTAMYSILATIEAAQPVETRTLWWVAAGFIEGLAFSTAPPGVFHKLLCGRIDAEIKHLVNGSTTIPELLLRRLLFAIAHMQPTTPRLGEIHATYLLGGLLPPKEEENPENTRVRVVLHDIKGPLEMVQETWLSFTTGNRASLSQFANEAVQLNKLAQGFNNKSLRTIFAKLVEVGEDLSANPRDPGALGLEMATMLLTARDALDNYGQLGADFDHLAQAVAMRVTAALRNRPLPEGAIVPLVNPRRTAEEKKLFSQLGQEILSNLNRIEAALDAFFRDPAKRPDLAALPGYIKQIEGVLAILESNDAVNLLTAGRDLVEKFIAASGPVDPQDAELTADIFSNLGLFVGSMQQGDKNPHEMLAPMLDRFGIKPSRSVATPLAGG